MTTQFRRCFRSYSAWCILALWGVLIVAGVASPATAQPYAAVLMDARTGEILEQTDNSNARLHPASLTKMMTLYIAFEALENGEIEEETRVRISQHAASQPPSRLGLRAGQTIAFRYLIRAAALRSGNDAAAAIAEAIEGSVPQFAARMNRTARAIGMTRTHFVNPHGLTAEGHLSSARDMATLARQLYFDHPDYYNIFSRMSDNAGIATVRNTNRLFLSSYRGADGIKTGFTNAAGYNLAAMAERGGVRMLVVVFGARSSQDRLRRVASLMDRGFSRAPSRVAVRRPARPDYVRGADDRGSGVAAGRTIRLQTAPTRSLFPRPRPAPDQAPPAEMLAAIRSEIDGVIEDIREPDTDAAVAAAEEARDAALAMAATVTETTEEPAEPGADASALVLAAIAPESSPLPRARPGVEVVELVNEDADETRVADATDLGIEPAIVEGPGVEATRGGSTVHVEMGTLAEAEEATEETTQAPEAAPVEIAAAAPEATTEPTESAEASPPTDAATLAALAALEPVATELSVDDDGRVLWRDEELLEALEHEDPEQPVLQPTIVLTSSDDADDDATPSTPLPEIVTRVSTSGGRVWRVELGRFSTSFDADRVLLGVALSEATTLRNGVRRVVTRGGRFVAEVQSLTQEEAELACLRLNARNQACEAVETATN